MTEPDDRPGDGSGSRRPPPSRGGSTSGSGRPPRGGSSGGASRSGGSSGASRSGGSSGASRGGGAAAGRDGDPAGAGDRQPTRGGRGRGGGGGRPDRAGGGGQRADRPATARREEPALPDDVSGAELDRAVRAELSSLATLNAEAVSRHLVMAGRLLDEDPETAYAHAVAARNRAGRVGAVREAAGIAAYLTGRYAEALAELRAARRISGDQSALPMMADCERGLGRPEKALSIAAGPEVSRLDAAGRAEMLIVASGARRDMGQPDAAALLLQGPELKPSRRRAWSGRLFYAYAEALLDAGREDEARAWFGHAADADGAGETDAGDRLSELEGVTFIDDGPPEDDDSPDDGGTPELAAPGPPGG